MSVNLPNSEYAQLVGERDALRAALVQCLEALRTVPEVGKQYDRQHADTQMQAVIAATYVLRAYP